MKDLVTFVFFQNLLHMSIFLSFFLNFRVFAAALFLGTLLLDISDKSYFLSNRLSIILFVTFEWVVEFWLDPFIINQPQLFFEFYQLIVIFRQSLIFLVFRIYTLLGNIWHTFLSLDHFCEDWVLLHVRNIGFELSTHDQLVISF